jgi:hypothetical protein
VCNGGAVLHKGERLTRRAKFQARGILVAALVLAWLAPPARGASLELLSVGPNGAGNTGDFSVFDAASADGTRVFFETNEDLTPDDTDGPAADVYERANGVTTRVSLGPNGGNGGNSVTFRAVSADGRHVFFQTGEQLVAGDDDGKCGDLAETYVSCYDVYDRSGGTTTQVSTGPAAAGGSFMARYRGRSTDGSRVFFSTAEQLVPADTDSATDVYERVGGTTNLVSTGPAGGNGDFAAYFKGCSDDGTHVFIETPERLTANDTDSEGDVYERSGGTTTLLSTGPAGGNGAFASAFRGASADGSRAFFETGERLTSADTDSATDVYQRSGGTTTLLSIGPAGGNGAQEAAYSGSSKDGSRVWFETKDSLVAGDTDSKQDVYERSGGSTTLVSTGPSGGSGAFDASFQGASDDGSKVWIGTFEHLAPTDTDSVFDIYERANGTTTQVTLGPAGGNGTDDAFFSGATADGSRVYFETLEPLVSADTDAYRDVYQRYGGVTTLISSAPNATQTGWSSFVDASDNGSRVFFETGDQLVAADTDDQSDVYASVDNGIYPRSKGATPFSVPLVIAYRDCTSANTVHGAPLANPSCTPPVPTSDWLRVGTPDSNGAGARSIGFVLLKTIVGNSSTPADEADLKLRLSVIDVRQMTGLGDYGGELQVKLAIRITDRLNGSAPVDPGTVQDIPFTFTGTCTPTSDTAIGSSCTADTTADALLPGAITEGARTIWQVGTVEVWDGGSDGDVDTRPNTLFERQGVFVP